VFAECPFSFELDEFEKTGLDVIFFGQNHYDTMAILQQRRGKEITQEEVGSLMDNQKLLSNKALMIKNFEEVVENLKECDSYIQEVLDGKRQGVLHGQHGNAGVDDCVKLRGRSHDLKLVQTAALPTPHPRKTQSNLRRKYSNPTTLPKTSQTRSGN
jgi:hypothetical protein